MRHRPSRSDSVHPYVICFDHFGLLTNIGLDRRMLLTAKPAFERKRAHAIERLTSGAHLSRQFIDNGTKGFSRYPDL
jgi:hypothetical protein